MVDELKIAFWSLSLLIAGCEIGRGVASFDRKLSPVTNLHCLDDAVRRTPGVEYLKSEESSSPSESSTNKSTLARTYRVFYKISAIPVDTPAIVQIEVLVPLREHEKNSEDAGFLYNKNNYSNGFGYGDGKKYSQSELETARRTLSDINESVRDSCHIADFHPNLPQ